jgi:hypothetical protein
MGITFTNVSAPTFEPIATYTVPSDTASAVTFSAIPATYTDLFLSGSCRANRNASGNMDFTITVNGNASSYSYLALNFVNTSTPSAYKATGQGIWAGSTAGKTDLFASFNAVIFNYASATKKYLNWWCGTPVNDSGRRVIGNWDNTAAVTSVELYGEQGWAANTTFTLYGIKAA